jgi:acyl-CoA reductase-like NAD-dependent aldehyde dehydrogenase
MVFKEPCGVVLGIAPWNAPIVSQLTVPSMIQV